MTKKMDRRVSLKMPSELYKQIEKLAVEQDRSVSNMIIVLLKEALKRKP